MVLMPRTCWINRCDYLTFPRSGYSLEACLCNQFHIGQDEYPQHKQIIVLKDASISGNMPHPVATAVCEQSSRIRKKTDYGHCCLAPAM